MSELITENAKIIETKLTMEDHGCLTFWIFIEMSHGCCGIGGYCIGKGFVGAEDFTGSEIGLEAMMRIMDTVGVSSWEKLPGNYIRVRHGGLGSSVTEIGNIIEDKWFNIDSFFKEKQKD